MPIEIFCASRESDKVENHDSTKVDFGWITGSPRKSTSILTSIKQSHLALLFGYFQIMNIYS